MVPSTPDTPPGDSGEEAVKEPREAEYGAASMQAETTRLMLLARQGDRQAFDELHERVRGLAFRVAQSLVGSHDDALELSQEALLKTYRARETFREGESFLPWFQRIVRNTCYSWMRKHKKVRSTSLTSIDEDGENSDWQIADPDTLSPVDPLVADERAKAFWVALARLGARDREILALRHFRELSYREIADTLAIPEGTVMSRLFHARRRLREALGPAFEDELGLAETTPSKKGAGHGRRGT